jgi:hypothetical protein
VEKDGVLTNAQSFVVNVLESNQPPSLQAMGNRTVNAGGTLSWTNFASDPDVPANALSFSLGTNAPAGAGIDALSGVFSWTAPQVASTITNTIIIEVTDNGAPALSDSKLFNAIVVAPPRVSTIGFSGQEMTFTWQTFPGKSYRVEFKNTLNETAWTPMGSETVAGGNSLSVTNSVLGDVQGFYRIVQVD